MDALILIWNDLTSQIIRLILSGTATIVGYILQAEKLGA